MDKSEIARQVRPITLEQAVDDMITLRRKWTSGELKPLSNAGLKLIDYYTFKHRLSVKGKGNMKAQVLDLTSTPSDMQFEQFFRLMAAIKCSFFGNAPFSFKFVRPGASGINSWGLS